jgi:hypothetical protein
LTGADAPPGRQVTFDTNTNTANKGKSAASGGAVPVAVGAGGAVAAGAELVSSYGVGKPDWLMLST